MTKIKTVTGFLENIAPLDLQENYDNSGLITGHPDMEITGVLTALDCTPAVVQEAIDKNYNLIVSHHPIVFTGLKKFSGDSYVERAIVQAIRHNIAIYAIHTNLDNVLHNGVNERIAQRLELNHLNILARKDDEGLTGSGIVGLLEKDMTPEDFLQFVKNRMELEVIKYTESSSIKTIHRIGICGGSGSFLLEKAMARECDAFISADFKYHQFFDAEDKIMILDIGHYESEKYTIQLLNELIINNFRNFAAQSTKINTNPVRYFT